MRPPLLLVTLFVALLTSVRGQVNDLENYATTFLEAKYAYFAYKIQWLAGNGKDMTMGGVKCKNRLVCCGFSEFFTALLGDDFAKVYVAGPADNSNFPNTDVEFDAFVQSINSVVGHENLLNYYSFDTLGIEREGFTGTSKEMIVLLTRNMLDAVAKTGSDIPLQDDPLQLQRHIQAAQTIATRLMLFSETSAPYLTEMAKVLQDDRDLKDFLVYDSDSIDWHETRRNIQRNMDSRLLPENIGARLLKTTRYFPQKFRSYSLLGEPDWDLIDGYQSYLQVLDESLASLERLLVRQPEPLPPQTQPLPPQSLSPQLVSPVSPQLLPQVLPENPVEDVGASGRVSEEAVTHLTAPEGLSAVITNVQDDFVLDYAALEYAAQQSQAQREVPTDPETAIESARLEAARSAQPGQGLRRFTREQRLPRSSRQGLPHVPSRGSRPSSRGSIGPDLPLDRGDAAGANPPFDDDDDDDNVVRENIDLYAYVARDPRFGGGGGLTQYGIPPLGAGNVAVSSPQLDEGEATEENPQGRVRRIFDRLKRPRFGRRRDTGD